VVLHRAILGSLDRFMAYLTEETKGAFPVWLAPVQVKVIPVSEKSLDYAEKIYETLRQERFRVELDDRNEKVGYKIRAARQDDKVPYMIIVGEKEAAEGTISVRDRATDQTTGSSLEEFVEKLRGEINNRSRQA
ncbi:MAG: threonine--tRNA ligase, partial [Blautia sp.]|nr:threonine--tRNA ligase [Blautia sp.]